MYMDLALDILVDFVILMVAVVDLKFIIYFYLFSISLLLIIDLKYIRYKIYSYKFCYLHDKNIDNNMDIIIKLLFIQSFIYWDITFLLLFVLKCMIVYKNVNITLDVFIVLKKGEW